MKNRQASFLTFLFLTIMNSVCMAENTVQPISPMANLRDMPIVSGLPKINFDGIRKMSDSMEFSKLGDQAIKIQHWKAAGLYYNQALDLWSESPDALYGLAQCAHAAGDTAREADYYRKAVYQSSYQQGTEQPPPFRETGIPRLMEAAIVLSKAGQAAEAIYVYHHAAAIVNYTSGKPNLQVLLPAFGNAPGQLSYTPQRLQALAHVAQSIVSKTFDGTVVVSEAQEAVRVSPDSPIANYYLGEALAGWHRPNREALAAYQAAARYGDAAMQAQVALVAPSVQAAVEWEDKAARDTAREKAQEAEKEQKEQDNVEATLAQVGKVALTLSAAERADMETVGLPLELVPLLKLTEDQTSVLKAVASADRSVRQQSKVAAQQRKDLRSLDVALRQIHQATQENMRHVLTDTQNALLDAYQKAHPQPGQ